jgi:hypothetical protein
LSGLDTDQKRTDSLLNAQLETLITSMGGSFAQNLVSMSDDAYRAYIHPRGGVSEAVSSGLSRYRDTVAKGAGVARPLLFNNYEQVAAVTDTNWQIVKEKDAGVELARTLYEKNVEAQGRTGTNAGTAEQMEDDTIFQNMRGTPNAVIGAAAKRLVSRLKDITQKQGELAERAEVVRNGYLTTQEKKNGKLNEITEQRKYYNLLRRTIIEEYEETIRERIGDPDFSFEDYDPNKYVNAPAE